MAVAWNGTVRGASRKDLLKKRKVDSTRAGRGTRMGVRTNSDVYKIVTYYKRIMPTHVCVNNDHFPFDIKM